MGYTKLTLANGWTTERVAEELGVKTRTVHHHVQAGNLHPQKYVRPGVEGGAINLFNPAEVTQFLQKRTDGKTKILPPDDSGPRLLPAKNPGSLSRMHQPALEVAHVREAFTAPLLPIDRKRYLTTEEAVLYTGLGSRYIQQNCESWPIGPRGKRVFRREDLDKL